MQENLKNFSERLREIREMKKWNQDDLARRADLQPSAISHFENGRRHPSFDNLKRLADALNVTVDYLLGRTDDPKSAGPVADALFRNFRQLSPDEQDIISRFTETLLKKNQDKGKTNGK
jgi:transcriptional regulator with XRE-family HTH domain